MKVFDLKNESKKTRLGGSMGCYCIGPNIFDGVKNGKKYSTRPKTLESQKTIFTI